MLELQNGGEGNFVLLWKLISYWWICNDPFPSGFSWNGKQKDISTFVISETRLKRWFGKPTWTAMAGFDFNFQFSIFSRENVFVENFELISQKESLSRLASPSLRQWWTTEGEEEEEEEDFQQSENPVVVGGTFSMCWSHPPFPRETFSTRIDGSTQTTLSNFRFFNEIFLVFDSNL